MPSLRSPKNMLSALKKYDLTHVSVKKTPPCCQAKQTPPCCQAKQRGKRRKIRGGKLLKRGKKHQKLEWAGSHSNILRIKLERQQIGNLECVDDLGKQLLLWTKSRDCGK